ncbi:MAG TPA: DNA modification methylase [Candidatus Cloacimonadota bacterium]|nr:DNA modification methylase [Candidatus Cloacimonadota bacterium]
MAERKEWRNRIVESGEIDLSEILFNKNNWKIHPREQYEAVLGSMEEIGWVQVLTINKTTGNLVDGHLRALLGAREGQKKAPCNWIEVSEEEEIKILIMLDPLAGMSIPDKSKLAEGLKLVQTDNAALQALFAQLGAAAGIAPDEEEEPPEARLDEIDALQKKWKTAVGQIWACGDHWIACGDSTDPKVVDNLLRNERVSLVWTDPPYGVDYINEITGKIINDNLVDNNFTRLLKGALEQAMRVTMDEAAFYIWHATGTRRDFEWAMDAVGLQENQYITWVKDNFTMGWSDYQWQTEPCFYCCKAGHNPAWYGDRTQSTVWQVKLVHGSDAMVSIANGIKISDGEHQPIYITLKAQKQKYRHMRLDRDQFVTISVPGQTDVWQVNRGNRNEYLHPNQKPVALAEIGIRNSSMPGQIVYDPFVGTGTVILACERLQRRGRAIDLDPKFVAVTLQRYKDMTGKDPIIIKTIKD